MANLIKPRKLRLESRKYKQFTSNYDSRVVIYDRKKFIRLATVDNLVNAL